MTLFDFVRTTKRDWDVYDNVYDAEVTVCYIDEDKELYDKFCNEIIKKVILIRQISDYSLEAKWTKLIEDNMEKFREFTRMHWHDEAQYEDDDDEFIYQWINEIHGYMAGCVSEDFYEVLVEFVKELEVKEE